MANLRRTGVLLNCLEDIWIAETKGWLDGTFLLASHAAVKNFLKFKMHKESLLLGEYSSLQELQDIRKQAGVLVDNVVDAMDQAYSRALCRHFSLPYFDIFKTRFSYIPKESGVVSLCALRCLIPRIMDEEKLGRLILFEQRGARDEERLFSMHDLQRLLGPRFVLEIEGPEPAPYDPSRVCQKKSPPRPRAIRFDQPGLVHFANAYDAVSLNDRWSELEHLVYHPAFLYPEGVRPPVIAPRAMPDIFEPVRLEGDVEALFARTILQHCQNFGPEFQALKVLNDLARRMPVVCAYWDVPPIFEFKSFVYADLMALGIPVVGMQHGGSYGEQKCPQHYYSDFMRCTNYMTYGFDENDLQESIGFNDNVPKLHKFGTVQFRKPKNEKNKKEIDILYVAVNSISELQNGLIRKPPHELSKIQLDVVNFLNKSSFNYIVKLPMGSSLENSALYCALEFFEKSKYTDIPLSSFLEIFAPKAVVLDFPSTPLYCVLPLDTEIFLIPDNSAPYTGQARSLLEKRVYFCENTSALFENIIGWKYGKLPQKRDDSFLNHFLKQDNTEEQLKKLIYDIAFPGGALSLSGETN